MPRTALLNEFWRDIVSLSSAAITVIGFVFTVISLIYAIKQIWMTRSAADAALQAANEAVIESRRNFERYTLSNALRYFAEAKLYINESNWDKAGLRLSDLAEQTAQLATLDAGWKEMTVELRQWSNIFARVSAGETRFTHRKWNSFAIKLQDKIDERHGPFGILSGV